MDNKTRILLVAGLLITIIAFFINIYAGGIVLIILATLVMSLFIMKDSVSLPDIVAEFTDDAKGIVIRNSGNDTAFDIHVALIPENIEYDLESLEPDASSVHPLEKMICSVKVVVTFRNTKQQAFSRTYPLSSTGDNFDPLKPMIPVFKWK
ncbi:hypothetical protein [uncultured Methanoregula sp.]|uniref:hypothetical protein n=1 Tax=uncultured Methanoregula sp. TaxID=1005933 RepID=UPI002AAB73CB|nr:hypothetical protein [uncultured Methanoregula sp.]